MFKRTKVEMTVPSTSALEMLEWLRQGFVSGVVEWDGWAYEGLAVDIALTRDGQPVLLNAAGGETVMYAGPAGDYLVFGILISEENNLGWLKRLLPLSRDEVPTDGQGVYIVAPNLPGQRCEAVLAVWCGDAESGVASGVMPLSDERILAFMSMIA